MYILSLPGGFIDLCLFRVLQVFKTQRGLLRLDCRVFLHTRSGQICRTIKRWQVKFFWGRRMEMISNSLFFLCTLSIKGISSLWIGWFNSCFHFDSLSSTSAFISSNQNFWLVDFGIIIFIAFYANFLYSLRLILVWTCLALVCPNVKSSFLFVSVFASLFNYCV